MPMNRIEVLLADDHQVVRQGMHALLNAQPDIHVIGEVTDGQELIQSLETLQPSVVLCDIVMPNLNGIDATLQIKKRFPNVRVIILSMHNTSSYVIRAFRSGAMGYVLKNDDIGAVIAAIHAVMEGRRYLSAQVSSDAIDTYLRDSMDETDLAGRLTRREREVLELVAAGNTSAQIAIKLSISIRTVDSHRANLIGKLGISSQVELVRFALRNGLTSLPE